MTAPAIDAPAVDTAPAPAPAVTDTAGELAATKAATVKAAQELAAAKARAADAVAERDAANVTESDAVAAGRKTQNEVSAILNVKAFERAYTVALIAELRAFAADLRRQASEAQADYIRQNGEAEEFDRAMEQRDGVLYAKHYPVNAPDVAGWVSQAAMADSRAAQLEAGLYAPPPAPRPKLNPANSPR